MMLYMPVIHAGYDRLLSKYASKAQVLLIGESFADEYPVVRKEIRALSPERVAKYIAATQAVADVRVVERGDLPEIVTGPTLILPDEDLMRDIAKRYHLAERARLHFERTFLRWDRSWSKATRPPKFTGRVTSDQLANSFARLALGVGRRSSDWWRQVGAVAVRDGEILVSAYNEHVPSAYSPYVNGDPRNNYRRGVRVDLSTALHAEAAVIADCARRGISLEGADLYVSTFPCPSCARLVAAAGFARCFFAGGYSTLDGDDILQAAGVESVYVMLDDADYQQLSFDDMEGSRQLGLD
ncbi:MAG: deoxycytidylate deaminase [Streptosporangiaceae bacterium]